MLDHPVVIGQLQAITDAVAIARYLGATLVLPDIRRSELGQKSEMYNEWIIELKAIADRIISMRQQLFDALRTRGTPDDWSHIIKQIGMFTFTGLNK